MHSLIFIIVSISFMTIFIATINYLLIGKISNSNSKLKSEISQESVKKNELYTSPQVKTPIVQVIEKQQIEHINTYDFKNSEAVYLPILTLFILFIILKKFNNITLKINSSINLIKTKSLLNRINNNKKENLISIINKTEIQLIKNKYIIEVCKNHTDLKSYNELLKSKHDFILDNMTS